MGVACTVRLVRAAGSVGIPTTSQSYVKMTDMANLTLIYGMRLLPEGEVTEIHDATLKLANGHEAHVTMHVLEGSREQIETATQAEPRCVLRFLSGDLSGP